MDKIELLPVDWYFQPPIDFEHKEYTLCAYLQRVDSSFLKRKLSPHLLHLEKLIRELEGFYKNTNGFLHSLESRKYKFFDNPILNNPTEDEIKTVIEVVELSIPQMDSRIVHGQKLLSKYRQILY